MTREADMTRSEITHQIAKCLRLNRPMTLNDIQQRAEALKIQLPDDPSRLSRAITPLVRLGLVKREHLKKGDYPDFTLKVDPKVLEAIRT